VKFALLNNDSVVEVRGGNMLFWLHDPFRGKFIDGGGFIYDFVDNELFELILNDFMDFVGDGGLCSDIRIDDGVLKVCGKISGKWTKVCVDGGVISVSKCWTSDGVTSDVRFCKVGEFVCLRGLL